MSLKRWMQSSCREDHILNSLSMRLNCTIKGMLSGLFLPVELVLSETSGRAFVQRQKYMMVIINPTVSFLPMCL